MKNVIIEAISNISEKGIQLKLNTPAKLKTGVLPSDTFWVSWDKIGKSLFQEYSEDPMKTRRNFPNISIK